MNHKKTVHLKNNSWSFEEGEDPALERLQNEHTEEDLKDMSLQDFLIALSKVEKAEHKDNQGRRNSDHLGAHVDI